MVLAVPMGLVGLQARVAVPPCTARTVLSNMETYGQTDGRKGHVTRTIVLTELVVVSADRFLTAWIELVHVLSIARRTYTDGLTAAAAAATW